MKAYSTLQKLIICVLSWAIILQPFSLVRPAIALAQVPAAEGDDNLNKIMLVRADIDRLRERVAYPLIPRLGPTGLPSASEISDLEVRMAEIRAKIQKTLINRIMSITSPESNDILPVVLEVAEFYRAAQKLEGLRLTLKQTIDWSRIDEKYGMSFKIDDLLQLTVFEALAFYSSTDAAIRGVKSPADENILNSQIQFTKEGTYIHLSLGDDFLELEEMLSLIANQKLQGTYQFAGFFAAHRLYSSMAAAHLLGTEPLANFPEPGLNWKNRYTSFRVARDRVVKSWRGLLYDRQKTTLVEAVYHVLKEWQKQKGGHALDASFWKQFKAISGGIEVPTEENSFKVEDINFMAALDSTVRAWPLEDLRTNLHSALYFAKRLSLRFSVLNNPTLGGRLSGYEYRQVSALLDTKARGFVDYLMKSPQLMQSVQTVLAINMETARNEERQKFFNRLREQSAKIKYFEQYEVNFSYLFASKQAQLEALKPSPMVSELIGSLAQKKSFQEAFADYQLYFYSLLQAYNVDSKDLSIAGVYKNKNNITFNPSSLSGEMPLEYLNALARDTAGRKKDLSDILDVARILKLDLYENIKEETVKNKEGVAVKVRRPTFANLQFSDGYLGGTFKSEKKAYLEELRRDVIDGAPVLGSNGLWEKLADKTTSPGVLTAMVSDEVMSAERQAQSNMDSLDRQLALVNGTSNDLKLKEIGKELGVLITRAAQLSTALKTSQRYSAYFDKMRDEILDPGFWNIQWKQFSSWANSASWALLGLFAASMVGGKIQMVGKAVDAIGTSLAPIFGIDFKLLSPMIWGLLGLGISEDAYRTYQEHDRANVLRRYYSCGTNKPCVAKYSDVVRQESLTFARGLKVAFSVLSVAVAWGGVTLALKFQTSRLQKFFTQLETQTDKDLQLMGIQRGTVLNENTLNDALIEAKRMARQSTDSTAAKVSEAYAEQAYNRLQLAILKEAKVQQVADGRLKPLADAINADLKLIKNPAALSTYLKRIEKDYADNVITSIEYVKMKDSVLRIYRHYAPIWQRMENRNSPLGGFYDAVWERSSGLTDIRISTSLEHYSSRLAPEFDAAIHEFYGTDVRRFDGVLGNILRELEKHPDATTAQLNRIYQGLLQELKK